MSFPGGVVDDDTVAVVVEVAVGVLIVRAIVMDRSTRTPCILFYYNFVFCIVEGKRRLQLEQSINQSLFKTYRVDMQQ
jgi:hypothetical protein